MKRAVLLIALLLSVWFIFAQKPPQDYAAIETGKPFLLQSAMNYGQDDGGYWDIPGNPRIIKKGSNIQVWDLDDGDDRHFYAHITPKEGYYEIVPASGSDMRLDVDGGAPNMKKNGTSIKVWERNQGDWQKFKFVHQGDGRFKIYTTSGMVVCLAGRSNKNGSNVHIWEDHEGAWMEWYLVDPSTKEKVMPIDPPAKPQFFLDNKNKTFKYDERNGDGTAKIKKITDNKIVFAVSSKQRNMANGKMETKNFDYEVFYRDGVYFTEHKQGKIITSRNGNKLLDLRGYRSVTKIELEE